MPGFIFPDGVQKNVSAVKSRCSKKSEANALKTAVMNVAGQGKEKAPFCYYRLTKGISGILSYAKESISLWFRTQRPLCRQFYLKPAVWTDKKIRLKKSGFGGTDKSTSSHRAAILTISKIRRIGAMGDYIWFQFTETHVIFFL